MGYGRPEQTSVCARVSFQIKRIVESLATKGAQITFDVGMTFRVTVEKTLEGKFLKEARLRQGTHLATGATRERAGLAGRL